tara:strand:+ start:2580 stop:2888 length:309 start_codon:yes stop_codon:yes gene_type:complete
MTLKEYYTHYLSLHKNKICRRFHVAGQIFTILFICGITYLGLSYNSYFLFLLTISPFVVYPFAWSGHFFFEKNTPAAFKHPIKAKICDWMMLFDIIRGKIKF